MASLKCNNCGFGIHYHDEPDGTEHFAIPPETWEWYRSSEKSVIRAFLDGPQNYLTIWRCRKCGCLHTFDAHSVHVKQAYALCQSISTDEMTNGKEFRVFDARLFDAIWEDNITANEYDASHPYGDCYYALIGDDYLLTFDDADLTHVTGCYQAIDTPAE